MVDCIVLPWGRNSSIAFTKLCVLNVCSLCTGREYRKFQNFEIPKIYFRNPVFNILSENFTFQKFPAIQYLYINRTDIVYP